MRLTIAPEADRKPIVDFLVRCKLDGVGEKRLNWVWDAEDFSPVKLAEKIVQGRIDKRLKELSLLDQLYIKDNSITVDELIKQTSKVLGESVRVRRFIKFTLGELSD